MVNKVTNRSKIAFFPATVSCRAAKFPFVCYPILAQFEYILSNLLRYISLRSKVFLLDMTSRGFHFLASNYFLSVAFEILLNATATHEHCYLGKKNFHIGLERVLYWTPCFAHEPSKK